MKTIRCPQCDLADWENVTVCKRCQFEFSSVPEEESLESPYQREGSEFQQEEMFGEEYDEFETATDQVPAYSSKPPLPEERFDPNYGQSPPPPVGQSYQPQYSYQTAKPKIRFAVTSLILGIVGMPFISMFWGMFLTIFLAIFLGMPGAVLGLVIVVLFIPSGLIFGIVSLVKSKRRPAEYGGKGLAVAGILCSSLGILIVPLVAAVAIPNFMAARRFANEGSAIASMEQIRYGQAYYRKMRGGHCGELSELKQANLLDGDFAKGQNSGYQFMVVKLPIEGGGCEVTATPISDFEGSLSLFYSTEDDVIRVAEKNGEMATKEDPPMDENNGRQFPKIASGDEPGS